MPMTGFIGPEDTRASTRRCGGYPPDMTRALLVLAAVAAAVLVAGCGGGGSREPQAVTEQPTTAEPPPATTTTPAATTSFRLYVVHDGKLGVEEKAVPATSAVGRAAL